MPAYMIILEGNISAGKSTLAKELGPALGCKVFLEPTLTNPYLERFYADPHAYGLKLQLWMLKQRYYIYVSALKHMLATGEGVLLDRSIFSDVVFANRGLKDGIISETGFRFYSALREKMLATLPIPHVTLYLDVKPEECYNRVHNNRKRECESGIPLEYLAGLDECYKEWVGEMATTTDSLVLTQGWDSYGGAQELVDRILSDQKDIGCEKTMDEWAGGSAANLLAFLADEKAVVANTSLSHTCPEGEDDDVEGPLLCDADMEFQAEAAEKAKEAAIAEAAKGINPDDRVPGLARVSI